MKTRKRHNVRLTVVVEKLLDQVNVSQHHASAAVSLQPKLIQSISEYKERLKLHSIRTITCTKL